jgi:hypothetical protein
MQVIYVIFGKTTQETGDWIQETGGWRLDTAYCLLIT